MRLLAISLTLTLTTAAFRAPPIRCCATGPASTKELYSKIDGIIRRARSKTDDRLASSMSRALGNRWLEMEPEKLVEATVVSGTVLLDSFDDGLDLLIEAEEGARQLHRHHLFCPHAARVGGEARRGVGLIRARPRSPSNRRRPAPLRDERRRAPRG